MRRKVGVAKRTGERWNEEGREGREKRKAWKKQMRKKRDREGEKKSK